MDIELVKQFLADVLPVSGVSKYYQCTGIYKPNPKDPTKQSLTPSKPRAITGFDALLKKVTRAIRDDEDHPERKQNHYFSTASFFANSVGRKKENVEKKQCFYLDFDVDTKKSTAYDSKDEALRAVVAVSKYLRMPPTYVIDSGGGFHIYWALSTPMSGTAWSLVARTMQDALCMDGFKPDPACTTDESRILRIPGTTNYKREKPHKVTIIRHAPSAVYTPEAFAQRFPLAESTVVDFNNLVPVDDAFETDGNFAVNEFQDSYVATILPQCASLKRMVDEGGKVCSDGSEISDGQWLSALRLLAKCKDGDQYAHAISKGYKGYTEHETNAKLEHAKTQKSPGLCKDFEGIYPDSCATCPKRGDIKTPWVLGYTRVVLGGSPPVGVQAIALSDMPPAYALDGNKTIVSTLNPAWVEGCPLPKYSPTPAFFGVVSNLRCIDLIANQVIQASVQFDYTTLAGRKQACCIPAADLEESRSCKAILSGGGIALKDDKEWESMRTMLRTWRQRIAHSKAGATQLADRLGYGTCEARTGFLLGEHMYWDDSVEDHIEIPAHSVQHLTNPRGTLEQWQRLIAQPLQVNHIPMNLVIAASFASVLMPFMPQQSVVLSYHSPASGTGKSTAMQIGASIWGQPLGYCLGSQDTANSRMRHAGLLHNLPILWDDVRVDTSDSKQLRAFIDSMFQGSAGREKKRAKANMEMATQTTWESLTILNSNFKMVDFLALVDGDATDASARRLVEFEFPAVPEARECRVFNVGELEGHSGVAGAAFIKYILENLDAVKKLCYSAHVKLMDKIPNPAQNRFMISLAAAIYVGASLAKAANIVDLNPNAVLKYMLKITQSHITLITHGSTTGKSFIPPDEAAMNGLALFLDTYITGTIVQDYFLYIGVGGNIVHGGRINVDYHPIKKNENRNPVAVVACRSKLGNAIAIKKGALKEWTRRNPRHHALLGQLDKLTTIPRSGVTYIAQFPLDKTISGAPALRANCYLLEQGSATGSLFPDESLFSDESLFPDGG